MRLQVVYNERKIRIEPSESRDKSSERIIHGLELRRNACPS